MALVRGTSGNNNLTGSSNNDFMFGYAGNDSLYAKGGNDNIFGGLGDDSLYGESGNDTLVGGLGNDTLSGGDGDNSLYGEAGNDSITINSSATGKNLLAGGAGDDYLRGGNGSDRLYGGDGTDELNGGYGNDRLRGGNGSDYLWGSYGNDTLIAGSGNDYINGAGLVYDSTGPQSFGDGEIDTLTGGSGEDTFQLWGGSGRAGINVYYDAEGNSDYALIADFNLNEDSIQLTSFEGGTFSPAEPISYILGASPTGLATGTGLYVDNPGTEANELVAILQDVSPNSLSLDGDYFKYYS